MRRSLMALRDGIMITFPAISCQMPSQSTKTQCWSLRTWDVIVFEKMINPPRWATECLDIGSV